MFETSAGFAMGSEGAAPRSLPLTAQDLLLQFIDVATDAINRDSSKAQSTLERVLTLMDGNAGTGGVPYKSPARGGLAPWQAKRIAGYILEHIGTRLCARELADLVRISPGHFHRVFKATFNETPTAYVIRQRVRAAQKLMLTTRDPLSHVALSCGLYDQAHLTRLFQRLVGQSPGIWRRQFGQSFQQTSQEPLGH